MTHRSYHFRTDLALQRAIRALPSLPALFTAKQLQRAMPDRSANQCRRLMRQLVARGYCRPESKHAVVPVTVDLPPDTASDRVLALLATRAELTGRDLVTALTVSRHTAHRLLERMADLGLLQRLPVTSTRAPRRYAAPVAAAPIRMATPAGCRDPHCACPVSDSDFDTRNGRLVRAICRRHELAAREAACSR
jgi:hypothetical protein